MTSIYYKSFSKVLHLAKKKIPFSFTVSFDEAIKKKLFGKLSPKLIDKTFQKYYNNISKYFYSILVNL